MKPVKNRSRQEIDNRYKWNIEAMYPEESLWEQDFEGQFFAVLFDQCRFGRNGQANRRGGDVFDVHSDADSVIPFRELGIASVDGCIFHESY